MSATFGALPRVQFIHAICHFEAQEVNNRMLQTVYDSELKWRSYNHWKPITPSWRKNFARLRNDFAAILHSGMEFLLKFPDICDRHVGSRMPQAESQLRSTAKSAFCCEVILQPFLCVCEISQTSFSPAKWSLVLPDICDRHIEIFFFRFLLSKSQNSPCKPPIVGFLSY